MDSTNEISMDKVTRDSLELKQHLDEATKLIRHFADKEYIHFDGRVKKLAQGYLDKYLKPKDPPLYGKFLILLKWRRDNTQYSTNEARNKDCFVHFKEIFKEELNGTAGLDEAIEKCGHVHWVNGLLREIKERLEND